MRHSSISHITGFYDLANYLKKLSDEQLQAFFDSPEVNDLSFLSKFDTDFNRPMAHILKDCERFIFSPAAQRPEVLAIKDKQGYPLSFRLLLGGPAHQFIKPINKGEAYIQTLIENNDHRVDLLKYGAFKGELRKWFIESPSRLWLLTDAAKDIRIIDIPFECDKDPYVWNHFPEEGPVDRCTLKPLMAVLAGARKFSPTVREHINLVYHKHPTIIDRLDRYADLDPFSMSYYGFDAASNARTANNSQALLLLAEHYQLAEGKSLDDVSGFDTDPFTNTPHYGNAFKELFINYALTTLNQHTEQVKALDAGGLLGTSTIQKNMNELTVLSKNVNFFKSQVTPSDAYYFNTEWLADVAETTQKSIAFLHEQYQRHYNANLAISNDVAPPAGMNP